MTNWDSYEDRLLNQGVTARERSLNRGKRSLLKLLPTNPSCKNVIINGKSIQLMINSGSKPHLKTFHTMPYGEVYAGDIVEWMNNKWLVLNADSDNELYIDGNLQQCNYILKWQDESGNIIESPCVKIGANLGADGNKVIISGNSKITIYISYNKDTIKLQRGKRFFIDNNKDLPTPFSCELPDNTSNVYNGHGYIVLSLSEDQRIEDDNVKLGICDYKEISSNPSPTTSYCKIQYKSLNIKSGYLKGSVFTALFFDENNNTLETATPIWELNCDFKDQIKVNKVDNKIILTVDNEKLIGRRLRLSLNDKEGVCQECSILIDVVGVF